MQLLREARVASGLSLVEIAERARVRGYDLDPIGLKQSLESSALPTWQTVTGVLTACGLAGMQIDRWMRVYHDLGAPTQPIAPVQPVSPVEEFADAEPVSVPPLVLSTAPATPARLGPRHFVIAGAVLVALVVVPLALFAGLGGDPDPVAVGATNTPSPTIGAPPAPLPGDEPSAEPSPTDLAAPTSPALPTTAKPSPRTITPPPPSPRPPSPSPSPPDGGVFRSGVVALEHGNGFDLDAGQAGGRQDIIRWDGDTLIRSNGARLERMASSPGKQECQAVQSWENGVTNLVAGQWLCVRTSEGRYGRLNITATGATLKLSYTIWT